MARILVFLGLCVVICINTPWLDLDLSLYPSFMSSLYNFAGPGRWVRRVWPGKGSILEHSRGMLCCQGSYCSRKLLEGVSGLWCLKECRTSSRLVGLASYPGLVVSAALEPVDRLMVASAVILSRRTSYAYNVRRWIAIIFGEEWSLEEAARRASSLRSPQPRILAAVIRRLAEVVLAPPKSLEALRRKLLAIRHIGPKTADAIILFTGFSTRVAPADTHLAKIYGQTISNRYVIPSKNYCLKMGPDCSKCLLRARCLSGIVVSRHKDAAGLVQTQSYVAGTLGLQDWRRSLYAILEKHYRE